MNKTTYSLVVALAILIFGGAIAMAQTKLGPLTDAIRWDQGAPYNSMCPNLAPVGCGAVAGGQIMKFYNQPPTGTGSKQIINSTTIIDFSKYTYDWSKILNVHTTSTPKVNNDEIAKLLFHVGVSMGMDYKTNGSGTSLPMVRYGMTEHFGFTKKMKTAYKELYTNEEWYDLIKTEIQNNRPIPFAGDGSRGGHIFVCDGYNDADKTVHFNYGWSGNSNEWKKPNLCQFPNIQSMILGAVPVGQDGNISFGPSVAMITPLQFSAYTPRLGEKFNIGVRVASFGSYAYKDQLGIGLFHEGSQEMSYLLAELPVNLPSYDPGYASNHYDNGRNVLFTNVAFPTTIPEGKYEMRLIAKNGAKWFPMQSVVRNVFKEAYANISLGYCDLSYPLGEDQCELTLVDKLEVNVANNKAIATFRIKNNDNEYDCDTEVFVVASPNNSLISTTWTPVTVQLKSQDMQSYTVTDIALPVGADVKTCRFSVVYNRKLTQLFAESANNRATCVPLLPSRNNFVEFTIPTEREIKFISFNEKTGIKIPSDYKLYNPDGTEDTAGKTWYPLWGNATCAVNGSMLVTSQIYVEDENTVLEWKLGSPFGKGVFYNYIVYVSINGNSYTAIKADAPAFNQRLSGESVARFSLSDYAGKYVNIAFERQDSERDLPFELYYFKILNIKTAKDISLQDAICTGSILSGESFPIQFTVKNHAAINVKKFTASYTIKGVTVSEDFETNIPFNELKTFTFNKEVNADGVAGDIVPLTVNISMSGEEGTALTNNSKELSYRIVQFYPKKGFIVLKATKLGCPACQNSFTAIDNTDLRFPEASSGIEVWRDGALKATDEFNVNGYFGSQTPAFWINKVFTNEITQTAIPIEASKRYAQLNPIANISAQAEYESPDSRVLKVKLTSHFAMPAKGKYTMGAYIVENNVHDINAQISPKPTGTGKITKNHVAVGTIGGVNGDKGFVITNPIAETEYSAEQTFTIPAELFNAGSSYRYRKDNMQVIGILYDANGNIINTSVSCYYLYLPSIAGLKFVPESGYETFKHIDEVESDGKGNHLILQKDRATLQAGADFKFKIIKDASWTGREIELIVNSNAQSNIGVKELLIPDQDGVYTISDANKHYFTEIRTLTATDGIVRRNGNQLILTGNWAQPGSLDLRDASITSLDLTAITITNDMSPINAANPNILIFVSSTADVPTSWKNVVKGDVATSISLKDGYAFENSKEFTATSITYTRDYTSAVWSSLVIPFSTPDIPSGIKAETFISPLEGKLKFRVKLALEANTPYITKVSQPETITFSANNALVPVTTAVKIPSSSYIFEPTFKKLDGDAVADLYVIQPDGVSFKKIDSSSSISPFRSFIRAIGSSSETILEIDHRDNPTYVENIQATNQLIIRNIDGGVEIISSIQQQVHIYSIDGRLIAILDLQAGSTKVSHLAQGVYILNKQKMIVR